MSDYNWEGGYLYDAEEGIANAVTGLTASGEGIPDHQRVKCVNDAAEAILLWLEDHDALEPGLQEVLVSVLEEGSA